MRHPATLDLTTLLYLTLQTPKDRSTRTTLTAQARQPRTTQLWRQDSKLKKMREQERPADTAHGRTCGTLAQATITMVTVNHKGRGQFHPAFKVVILAHRRVSSMVKTIEHTRVEVVFWANWRVSLQGRLVARVTAVVAVPSDNMAAQQGMAAIHHSNMATVAATHSKVMADSMAISRGTEVVVACWAA